MAIYVDISQCSIKVLAHMETIMRYKGGMSYPHIFHRRKVTSLEMGDGQHMSRPAEVDLADAVGNTISSSISEHGILFLIITTLSNFPPSNTQAANFIGSQAQRVTIFYSLGYPMVGETASI